MTDDQGSLFDPDGGRRARDEGMNRVEHDNDSWNRACDLAIAACASRASTFTSEDVRQYLAAYHPELTPRDNRALGPRMKAAQTRGLIHPTDRVMNARIKSRHSGTVRIWTKT